MKNLLIIFLFLFCVQPVFAQKMPVKITPNQVISTHHDEVEIGDWIKFQVVQDVYDGSTLLFKKGSPFVGIVDYEADNGFLGDNAEICFKRFKAINAKGEKVDIPCNFTLGRKDYLTPRFKDRIVKYFGVFFRGNEILIQPNSVNYNIILEN